MIPSNFASLGLIGPSRSLPISTEMTARGFFASAVRWNNMPPIFCRSAPSLGFGGAGTGFFFITDSPLASHYDGK